VNEYLNILLLPIGVGVGWFLKSYLSEKGKNLATKEDIDRIVRKTEEIKAEISGGLWEKQNRWTFKRDVYVRLLNGLGDAASAVRQLLYLDEQLPAGAGPEYPVAKQMGPYFDDLQNAMVEIRHAAFVVPVVCSEATKNALDRLLAQWLEAEKAGGRPYLATTRTALSGAIDAVTISAQQDLRLTPSEERKQ
jgi:hypothetical protein